jgi:hypothetical protein
MAHYCHYALLSATAAKKCLDTFGDCCTSDTLAINLTLQALPRKLARRQKPNGVAHRLFASAEGGINQSTTFCYGREHFVVRNNSIIEIDANPKIQGHGDHSI